jgi:hypothetical protein
MSAPTVVRDLVVAHTRMLKLPGVARTFESLARQARDSHWSHEDYLHEVLPAEEASRHESVIRQRLREARFPEVKTLDTFDFAAADGVNATQIHTLARGEWITAPENLILAGPIGTGKTHLAIALGVEATKQKRRVLFTRAAERARSSASNNRPQVRTDELTARRWRDRCVRRATVSRSPSARPQPNATRVLSPGVGTDQIGTVNQGATRETGRKLRRLALLRTTAEGRDAPLGSLFRQTVFCAPTRRRTSRRYSQLLAAASQREKRSAFSDTPSLMDHDLTAFHHLWWKCHDQAAGAVVNRELELADSGPASMKDVDDEGHILFIVVDV